MPTTTRKRSWTEQLPFNKWIREQPEIDSHRECFSATNIDFMWEGPNNPGYWLLLETKQYGSTVEKWQLIAFSRIHKAITDPLYRGFHILQFEKTSPKDGAMFLDGRFMIRKDLIEFLRFEKSRSDYETTFNQSRNNRDSLQPEVSAKHTERSF